MSDDYEQINLRALWLAFELVQNVGERPSSM